MGALHIETLFTYAFDTLANFLVCYWTSVHNLKLRSTSISLSPWLDSLPRLQSRFKILQLVKDFMVWANFWWMWLNLLLQRDRRVPTAVCKVAKECIYVSGNTLFGHYKTTRIGFPDVGRIISARSWWSEDFIVRLHGVTIVSAATGRIVCKLGFTSPLSVHAK